MNTIFYILFFLLISCNDYQKEIYIIPEHFRGRVNVIFGQKNGENKVYENENRIYKIPVDGLLVTQFEKQQGYMNTEYYFINNNNNNKRIQLKIDSRSNKLEENEIGIYREGTRGVYGNSSDKDSFKYLEFYVTNEKKLKNYFSDDSINLFTKKVTDKVNSIKWIK